MSPDQIKNSFAALFIFAILAVMFAPIFDEMLRDSKPSLKVGDCVANMVPNEFNPSKSSGYLKIIKVGKTQYLTEKYDQLNNLVDRENVERISLIDRDPKKYKLTPCQELQIKNENQ